MHLPKPSLPRPWLALGMALVLYAVVFLTRAAQIVDTEAADTLLAAPIALVAVTSGAMGGLLAGLVGAAVFAGAEAVDTSDLTWEEVAVRAVGFTALGAFVGAVAALLVRSKAQFTGAFNNAPHGILLTDDDGQILAANAAVSLLLGRANDSLIGASLTSLTDPFDIGTDDAQWRALQAGELPAYTSERRLAGLGERTVPVLMAVSRMPPSTQGAAVIVHLVDLTAQRRSEQQLAHLADHDPLTDLFNRRRFDEELARHLRRVSRHGPAGAVLLLDLDHFKYVNDTLGHTAGDTVLRAIAHALSARVRAEDILARLGGDEFAVLLPDARTAHDVQAAAADILAVISGIRVRLPASLTRPAGDVQVTASIGAVLVPTFSDVDGLLAAADLAMYEAKEAGRGQARIHSPHSPHAERIRAGFTWGERIRQALADQRFELHLQPITPLFGAPTEQYEVLLRLLDQDRLRYPEEFLHHAERLGLMIDIDRYVIEHAILLLAKIPRRRRPRLEVNLSAVSLGDPGLNEWIATALSQHNVSASHLIFEITETVAITNMPLAASTIHQLRDGGSAFALDDFGVGVSSFYYLRELPFDILKIDGEFVRDLPTSPADQLIVRSMIDTAHGLGKSTVAEYVESAEVASVLRRLGCDAAQGHFFGSARPAGEVLHE